MERNTMTKEEMALLDPTERSLKVYEIMSFPIVTSFEDDDIKSIAVKMLKHKIGSVIVTNRTGKELGIITQGDIIRLLASSKHKDVLYTFKARELMSEPLIWISGDKELEFAAKTMVKYKIKKLCVRDANKKLAGMITDNDIMKNASYLIDVLTEMINTGYVRDI